MNYNIVNKDLESIKKKVTSELEDKVLNPAELLLKKEGETTIEKEINDAAKIADKDI